MQKAHVPIASLDGTVTKLNTSVTHMRRHPKKMFSTTPTTTTHIIITTTLMSMDRGRF